LVNGVVVVSASQFDAYTLTSAAGLWELVTQNMIRSFGLGFIFIPVSIVALSDLPAAERGNATGLFNLTRELGGSLGTALMGMLVSDDIKRFGSRLSEHVTLFDAPVQEQLRQIAAATGAFTYQRELVAESVLKLRVTTQAMVLSFENGFRYTALAMALGLALILLLKKPAAGAAVEGAH
jgi:DHA2 family multidrug resistance protein